MILMSGKLPYLSRIQKTCQFTIFERIFMRKKQNYHTSAVSDEWKITIFELIPRKNVEKEPFLNKKHRSNPIENVQKGPFLIKKHRSNSIENVQKWLFMHKIHRSNPIENVEKGPFLNKKHRSNPIENVQKGPFLNKKHRTNPIENVQKGPFLNKKHRSNPIENVQKEPFLNKKHGSRTQPLHAKTDFWWYFSSHFHNVCKISRKTMKKHLAQEIMFENLKNIKKKTHLKFECWQVIGLIYRWNLDVFSKCIKETPHIIYIYEVESPSG